MVCMLHYGAKALANMLSCVDTTPALISRLERLRSLTLFVQIVKKGGACQFVTGLKLTINVLNSLVRLHALTIKLEYESDDLYLLSREFCDPETVHVCQRFEESSIRLNPSRILFAVRSNRHERIVYWTRTLQRIFPTLHKRCPLTIYCQRGQRSSAQ